MKLNAISVMMAEKLENKPFFDFDLTDIGTLKTLAYCMYVTNSEAYTREEFENIFRVKGGEKILKKVMNEIEYLRQFQESEPVGEVEGETVSVTEIINRIIAIGRVSQSYVLKEMRLWELKGILKASEDYMREEMEQRRFWAYISIAPHVDGKKIKKPSDLISFPWEKEKEAKQKETEMEQGIKMFEKFFNSTKS